jgi:pseudaminic acid cytidylyltransferase
VVIENREIDKCLAIIPARGGSSRIPRKNILEFEGSPMLVHAIRLARLVGRFDEVLVSTDDEEIASLAKNYGASVPFMRSATASNDHASTFDVVHEVLERLQDLDEAWDIGVCIYPTAVLSRPEHIREAIDRVALAGEAKVMPVTSFDYPIWRAMSVEPGGALGFVFPEHADCRSQDLLPSFHDAGQWYAFRVSHLSRESNFIDAHTRAMIISPVDVQDIDTFDDLKIASLKFRQQHPVLTQRVERSQRWVLIRVDATNETGSGHVMRCIALAEALSSQGYDVVFVSFYCSSSLREIIEDAGFESVILKAFDECNSPPMLVDAECCVRWVMGQSSNPDWIVVDHYSLDIAWERVIRCLGSRLLVVDDLADRAHNCDVLLDHNMLKEHHERYPQLVQDETRLLLGGSYALLRREFANTEARRAELLAKDRAGDVVIFLGGTDALKLTIPLVSCLSKFLEPERLVVIVGSLNEHSLDIQDWCQDHGVRCDVSVNDMSVVLERCRTLVTACGMLAVEAQAIGIPCILIPLSSIQFKVAAWFESQGRAVIVEADRCTDTAKIQAAWQALLGISIDNSRDYPISVHGAKHVVQVLMEESR